VVGRSPCLGVVEERFPLVPATESAAAGAGLVLGPALAAAAAAAEEEPRDHPEVDGEPRLRPAWFGLGLLCQRQFYQVIS
jgi:hypothetical protein